ncbi:MAG: hypothetical protein PHP42_09210 [Bacteroidota bacterium]|nr:hypothetical protein [Bacteroidota bacterium]
MIGIIIWAVLILLAVALLWAIISGKMKSEGNFAAMSEFGNLQNQEKRNAMETVIDEKAGKKRFEQESGEKEKLDSEKH